MKIPTIKNERGGVLLVTMIFILTMAGTLGSYLMIIQNSNQLVARGQAWNNALAVAESGIEEGLARLNAASVNPFSIRYLNGGNYQVTYVNVGGNLAVRSVGTVTVPYTGDTVARTVQVTVAKTGLFMMGLLAINNIRFNGNGIASDSWNAHDPTQSTNGYYNGYVGTNGDVGSIQGVVDIGNHIISGSLYLGPHATYTGRSANVLGDIYTDANLTFQDVSIPTQDDHGHNIYWESAPTTTTGSGKTAVTTHTFSDGGYYLVYDNYPVTVNAGVNVTLDVRTANWNPTTLSINGGTINSGNVVLYLRSGDITLAGNNSGGASANRPENLYVFGYPAVTSITLSGNSSFVGAIYAPAAELTLNGGGNANNLIGAAVVNTVTLNGHYDFHYDTSLGTNRYSRGNAVSSWKEL